MSAVRVGALRASPPVPIGVRNGILHTGNFHVPVDAEYRSYYTNAQCIISVIVIIYYRFVYYYRYVRIIY